VSEQKVSMEAGKCFWPRKPSAMLCFAAFPAAVADLQRSSGQHWDFPVPLAFSILRPFSIFSTLTPIPLPTTLQSPHTAAGHMVLHKRQKKLPDKGRGMLDTQAATVQVLVTLCTQLRLPGASRCVSKSSVQDSLSSETSCCTGKVINLQLA